jgi:glucan phosphoethanolaminetransferase (alkaline phosphatase superfamily)
VAYCFSYLVLFNAIIVLKSVCMPQCVCVCVCVCVLVFMSINYFKNCFWMPEKVAQAETEVVLRIKISFSSSQCSLHYAAFLERVE